jgi:hypothetical protein
MKSLLTSLFLFAGILLSFGQTPAVSPAPEHVDIKFTLVGWGQEIANLEYRTSGSIKKTGVIPLFTRSKKFEYSGPAALEFYREPADGEKKTTEKNRVVATATIPSGLKRAMILMAPQGDRYQAMVVPDDLDSVPGGQALVMNLCDTPIAIRTNKTDVFTLAPGAGKLVSPGTKSLLLLQMEVGVQENSVWKKSDNCFLPLPPAYQTVVFFLKSDSDYFKDVDGRVIKPTQMVVLREPVEASAPPIAAATP